MSHSVWNQSFSFFLILCMLFNNLIDAVNMTEFFYFDSCLETVDPYVNDI